MSLLIYLRGIILNAHYTFYVNSQFSISCISFFICPLKSLPVCVASIFKNARQDSRNLTKTNLYKPALLPFHFVSPDWRSNIWKNKMNYKLNLNLQLYGVIIRSKKCVKLMKGANIRQGIKLWLMPGTMTCDFHFMGHMLSN